MCHAHSTGKNTTFLHQSGKLAIFPCLTSHHTPHKGDAAANLLCRIAFYKCSFEYRIKMKMITNDCLYHSFACILIKSGYPFDILIIPPTLDYLTRNDVSVLPTAKNSGTIPTFSVTMLHCIISRQEVKGVASVLQPASESRNNPHFYPRSSGMSTISAKFILANSAIISVISAA